MALAGIDDAAAQLKPVLDRYQLVGQPASPIAAPHWLNADPSGGKLDMKGAVTWLQFTAHWCGPCRESYPGVVRLHQRFAGKGFRVVMATQLYGRFEAESDLSPERELAKDREIGRAHV